MPETGSVTHWIRLEPETRGEPSEGGLEPGLAARTADPLWLMARQWQFGEFKGEDAGTPVFARARLDMAPITRFRPGPPEASAPSAAYDPARLPLEAMVEAEALSPMTLRQSAIAGQHFLRLLEHNGADAHRRDFIAAYPLVSPPDADLAPKDRAWLKLTAGRVPDGAALRAALEPHLRPDDGSAIGLPPEPDIDPANRAEVIIAGLEWLRWLDALFQEPGQPAPTWASDRQEYAFGLAANSGDGQVVLEVEEFAEGHLDWWAFNRDSSGTLAVEPTDASPRSISRSVIPAPVSYKGMPASRWWELEDASVNFGAMEAEPTDLVRLLLIEFGLVYANDWYVMPVELDFGALYSVNSLVVTDTFGERLLIHSGAQVDGVDSPFRLFSLSDRNGEPPAGRSELLFPPVLADNIEGRPVEEVLFLRDEMANMAWAVEKHVQSPVGHVIDRDLEFHTRRAAEPEPPAATDGAPVEFRLAGTPPEHWIPLVPVAEDSEGQVRLRRGKVIGPDLLASAPQGRLLEPGEPLSLREEEVPRAGARVTRAWQHARWSDGSTHVWIGRRKGAGRGEGFSGLRFDQGRNTGADPALTEGRNDLQPDAAFGRTRFDGPEGFVDED